MSQNAVDTPWSLELLLDLFDVTPAGADRYTADTGIPGDEGRVVVEGTQVLAQAIVAAAKRFPGKSIRSAQAVFARVVTVGTAVEFDVDVVQEGRTTATAVVTASQNGKRCVTVTVLADVPTADLIAHHLPRPDVAPPQEAFDGRMPLRGRDIRVVDVENVDSPDEVGSPELYAWLRYDPVPDRDDLAKALLAHFTGHLGISTTMRAHAGIGTSQAHLTVSTAPMTLAISFHEPARWDGWILYSHESTQAGAGMSYVRGTVHTADGALLASFVQDGIIRPLRASDSAVDTHARL